MLWVGIVARTVGAASELHGESLAHELGAV